MRSFLIGICGALIGGCATQAIIHGDYATIMVAIAVLALFALLIVDKAVE